jgi:hypothetical protein
MYLFINITEITLPKINKHCKIIILECFPKKNMVENDIKFEHITTIDETIIKYKNLFDLFSNNLPVKLEHIRKSSEIKNNIIMAKIIIILLYISILLYKIEIF